MFSVLLAAGRTDHTSANDPPVRTLLNENDDGIISGRSLIRSRDVQRHWLSFPQRHRSDVADNVAIVELATVVFARSDSHGRMIEHVQQPHGRVVNGLVRESADSDVQRVWR